VEVIKSIKKMQGIARDLRMAGKTIGLVPTMGALHEGHLSLIRKAVKENDVSVASIFVNPVQFGPKEDFKRYPRQINKDLAFCRKSGLDFIFCPRLKDIYPTGYKTFIEVKELSDVLCGAIRGRGHFRGVATVVAKLFNITQPSCAYFGQKDAQQAVIIKKMVSDLNMPVKVRVMPIIREKDGLALSSRNIYLSREERKDALALSAALHIAGDLVKSGASDADKIIRKIKEIIKTKKTAKVDYISIVDPDNLKPVKEITGRCLITLAAWIGKTRLIDNIVVKP
jgi:pantoate--beta-alanine ligase